MPFFKIWKDFWALRLNFREESTIPLFYKNRWYTLTTEWLGKIKSLDIVNDCKNNKLIMAGSGNYSGQHWLITMV